MALFDFLSAWGSGDRIVLCTCSLDMHQKTRRGEPPERCNFWSPINTLTKPLTIRVLYRSRNVAWMRGLAVGRLCDPPGKPLPHIM